MSTEQNAEKAECGRRHPGACAWVGKGSPMGAVCLQPESPHATEQDEVLGTYAPRCPRCGWQDQHRDYTERTKATQHALALTQVAQHKAECPGIPPASLTSKRPERPGGED